MVVCVCVCVCVRACVRACLTRAKGRVFVPLSFSFFRARARVYAHALRCTAARAVATPPHSTTMLQLRLRTKQPS